ncbi:hypothetical protein [Caballeronia sp. LjRoot31]|uniref:hypothetical protein n=1 Tax=Caballeronia sp. LjRoot31 TaxID=3342324 RepID=UPI003ED02CD4
MSAIENKVPAVQLGRIDTSIADALEFLRSDLASLAGVESSRLVFEVKLTLLTTTAQGYPLGIKVERTDIAEGRPYSFETSHRARTPDQMSPYITSLSYESTVLAAIHTAIGTVKSYVDQAIQNGHRFDIGWLVPNPAY